MRQLTISKTATIRGNKRGGIAKRAVGAKVVKGALFNMSDKHILKNLATAWNYVLAPVIGKATITNPYYVQFSKAYGKAFGIKGKLLTQKKVGVTKRATAQKLAGGGHE